MGTWQPIETALKDGTRVLIFGEGDVGEACFRGGQWWWKNQYKPMTPYDPYCEPVQGATHWMPLPAPPAE